MIAKPRQELAWIAGAIDAVARESRLALRVNPDTFYMDRAATLAADMIAEFMTAAGIPTKSQRNEVFNVWEKIVITRGRHHWNFARVQWEASNGRATTNYTDIADAIRALQRIRVSLCIGRRLLAGMSLSVDMADIDGLHARATIGWPALVVDPQFWHRAGVPVPEGDSPLDSVPVSLPVARAFVRGQATLGQIFDYLQEIGLPGAAELAGAMQQ